MAADKSAIYISTNLGKDTTNLKSLTSSNFVTFYSYNRDGREHRSETTFKKLP